MPSRREYLWSGFLLFYVVAASGFADTYSPNLLAADWVIHIERASLAITDVALIPFVSTLAGFRRRWFICFAQLVVVSYPRVGVFGTNSRAYHYDCQIAVISSGVVTFAILVYGDRRGKKECGLLLLAHSSGAIPDLVSMFRGCLEPIPGVKLEA